MKISSRKVNSQAMRDGQFVRPWPDEDLEIRTRGITHAFIDAQARRQRRAAQGFGGDVDALPVNVRQKINVDCLIEFCLLDVRNLHHDDGRPVTFDEFKTMLYDPDLEDYVSACFTAAKMVGRATEAEVQEAAGNSAGASDGTSIGGASSAS